jgi:hypothetical protein
MNLPALVQHGGPPLPMFAELRTTWIHMGATRAGQTVQGGLGQQVCVLPLATKLMFYPPAKLYTIGP